MPPASGRGANSRISWQQALLTGFLSTVEAWIPGFRVLLGLYCQEVTSFPGFVKVSQSSPQGDLWGFGLLTHPLRPVDTVTTHSPPSAWGGLGAARA